MIKVSDKEEFLDILNDDGTPTGKIEKRSIVHKNKLFHNEVALWIIDKENKRVLLQKRSPLKKQNPNKLALCAGHVVSGETIEEALKKEAKEEINIDITNYDVKKLKIIKRTSKPLFFTSFLYFSKYSYQFIDCTKRGIVRNIVYELL